MNKKSSYRNRNDMKAKLAAALGERLEPLPVVHQEILLDDLVTAFENRLAILRQVGGVKMGVEALGLINVEV